MAPARPVYLELVNRDIKPGGLAEYGIYPTKYTMKSGLRKQFHQILENPGIDYYGNISIGAQGDLNIEDLQKLGVERCAVVLGFHAHWLWN